MITFERHIIASLILCFLVGCVHLSKHVNYTYNIFFPKNIMQAYAFLYLVIPTII